MNSIIPARRYTLLVFAVALLFSTIWQMGIQWKSQASATTIRVASSDGVIPANAIRLRIIANSDSAADQKLKEALRDRIILEVGKKLQGATTPEQARKILKENVPDFNQIASEFLKSKGSSYQIQTKFGMVPFPTKLYGDRVYPAGNYEALRFIIGAGAGQNWWCVLFPALCFIDLANGDAVPKNMPEHLAKTTSSQSTPALGHVSLSTADGNQTFAIRFKLLDMILSWF